jgi:anti-anti-sigma factor
MVAVEERAFAEETGFAVDPHIGVGETRLVLAGELDLATAPVFLGALAFALHPRPALVVLDLRRLTFIDARSAGAIATASLRMGDWGGTLAARDPQRIVRRVFELCGLGDLLTPLAGLASAPKRPVRRGAETPRARPARMAETAEPGVTAR